MFAVLKVAATPVLPPAKDGVSPDMKAQVIDRGIKTIEEAELICSLQEISEKLPPSSENAPKFVIVGDTTSESSVSKEPDRLEIVIANGGHSLGLRVNDSISALSIVSAVHLMNGLDMAITEAEKIRLEAAGAYAYTDFSNICH